MVFFICLILAMVFAVTITLLTGAGPLGAFLIGLACGSIAGIAGALLEG